jgi:hypothetical protein
LVNISVNGIVPSDVRADRIGGARRMEAARHYLEYEISLKV